MNRTSRPVPFVRGLRVRNYRSIADCTVALGPLTVLLGFNASGKSNFLDALNFVADALATSPGRAVEERGGIGELLRRSEEPVDSFRIELELALPPETEGVHEPIPARYAVEIGPDPENRLPCVVLQEECTVDLPQGRYTFHAVDTGEGRPAHPRSRSVSVNPPDGKATRERASGDVLHLLVAALFEGPFPPVAAGLSATACYDLDAETLRAVDTDTTRRSRLGSPSGAHLGHVLGELEQNHPPVKERLDAYLSALVANAVGIDERMEGRYSTVAARFLVGGTPHLDAKTDVFSRETLSEGTLLAAGVLAALFQPAVLEGELSLLAIEEPEKALHPATVGTLYEALTDTAERVQTIITSQSSELLDSEQADLSHIRAVANVDGATYIGPVDGHGRELVETELMSISELHQSGQMRPEQVGYPAEGRR